MASRRGFNTENVHLCVSLDPTKLAGTVTKVIRSIFVNEEEVNRAFSLASKRQFTKVSSKYVICRKV